MNNIFESLASVNRSKSTAQRRHRHARTPTARSSRKVTDISLADFFTA